LTIKPNIQIHTQFSHRKNSDFFLLFSSLFLPLLPSFLLALVGGEVAPGPEVPEPTNPVVRIARAGDGMPGRWGCGIEAPVNGALRVGVMRT
jgi:hypothetical protein